MRFDLYRLCLVLDIPRSMIRVHLSPRGNRWKTRGTILLMSKVNMIALQRVLAINLFFVQYRGGGH